MTDDIEMAGHTFRRKNGAWYTVWHSAGQQGFTRIIDHAPTLAPFLDEIERLRTEVDQHHDGNILSECHWCGWQDKAALRGDVDD